MHVLSNAPDPRLGGPLKRALAVARRLRPRGIETTFLVPTGDDRFVGRARERGFECVRIRQPRVRSPRNVRANLRFLSGLYGCVRETEAVIDDRDVDVVHANGPLNYAVALAAARSDASLVWHFNDTLTPTPLKQLSARLAERWADRIVVAADAVGRYFFHGSADAKTVYAPVDLDRFDRESVRSPTAELRAELGIPEGVPVVGSVGNVNPAKGYEYLIEAFASLDTNAHLVIVGQLLESQRAYSERLQRRIRALGIESDVTFTGWRDDVPRLLDTLDVFVLASVTEACPTVVLEAMAMECPVVATDVGGVREQLPGDRYGWIVPPEEPDVLSESIESALSSERERRRRAELARARVEAVFSLDACVDDHVELYRSVVSDP